MIKQQTAAYESSPLHRVAATTETGKREIPLVPGRPIVGNLFEFLEDPSGFLSGIFREYGDVSRFRLPGQKVTFFADPEDAKSIHRESERSFSKVHLRFLELMLKRGMLMSGGEVWRRKRRLFQPHYHPQSTIQQTDMMVGIVRKMVARWSQLAAASRPVEVCGEFARVAIETSATGLFGDGFREEHLPVMLRTAKLIPRFIARNMPVPFISWRVPLPWNRDMTAATRALERTLDDIIASHKVNDSPDVLSTVLREHPDIDRTMLRDELIGLLFGGIETSFASLSWAIYLLAKSPHWYARLQQEADEVLDGAPPTSDRFRELVCTYRIVQEVLRLYPSFPMIWRQARQDTEVNGHPVRKGEAVMISAWVTHRHPEFWQDPESFDPDRFSPERSANRPAAAYFPFGEGPHICIGRSFALLELSITLVMIAQRFDLNLVDGHPPVRPTGIPIRPGSDVLVEVRRRTAVGAA